MIHKLALFGWFIFIPAVLVFITTWSFEKFWMTIGAFFIGILCAALAALAQLKIELIRWKSKKEKNNVQRL